MALPGWGNIGSLNASTTNASPVYPNSIPAGAALFCVVWSKASSGTGEPPAVSAPSGWTRVSNRWGGTGTAGTNTGPVKVSVFRKDVDAAGTEGGTTATNLIANPASSSMVAAALFYVTYTSGATLTVVEDFGQVTSSATGWTPAIGSNPPFQQDDLLLGLYGVTSATPTLSGESISGTSLSVGSTSERLDTSTATGFGVRAGVASNAVTAGTSTAAPTVNVTLSSGSTGVVVGMALRETGITRELEDFSGGSNGASLAITDGKFDNGGQTPASTTATYDNSTTWQSAALCGKYVGLSGGGGAGPMRSLNICGGLRTTGEYGAAVNFDALPGSGATFIFARGISNTTNRWQLRLLNTGAIVLRDNVTARYTTSTLISTNTWYYIVVHVSGSNFGMTLYDANGLVLEASATNLSLVGNSFDRWQVGQIADPGVSQTMRVAHQTYDTGSTLGQPVHRVTLNQANESDTPQAIGKIKHVALGQATETDTANTLTRIFLVTYVALGQASETDSAQPVGKLKFAAVGQASETDTANAVTAESLYSVNRASETDTANALTLHRTYYYALGQASETDEAQPLSSEKFKSFGQASETDEARNVNVVGVRTVAAANETDTAQSIGARKLYTLGRASETDAAQAFDKLKFLAVGQADETDAAQDVSPSHRQPFAQVFEVDTAGGITPIRVYTLGRAGEVDEATQFSGIKFRTFGQADEVDYARHLHLLHTDLSVTVGELVRKYHIEAPERAYETTSPVRRYHAGALKR